jgi:hypothetical protein
MAEIKDQLKELKFGFIKYSMPSEAILASTTMSQLLSVPYKSSDAGSNPREFQGMKSTTNKKILQSFLKNHATSFWALHSGVSITVTEGRSVESVLTFDDACLTNGLQTVTIGRILTLIKAYQLYTDKTEVHTKINRNMEEKWKECIHYSFPPDVTRQLLGISLLHVNSVLTWLQQKGNEEYLTIANRMSLRDILDSKLSVKVVLLDKLAPFARKVDGEPDLEGLGDKIAEANNETQKVEAGDLFGTGNREWLKNNFPQSIRFESTTIKIEYRRFSEDRKDPNQKVIHVLDLLRAILPTTLVIDSDAEDLVSFVADYANRREPIYNWFNKVIKIHQAHQDSEMQHVVRILHNLIPDLIHMMLAAQAYWEEQRRALSYDVVNAWTPLKNTSLSARIFDDPKSARPNERADSEIRTFLNFSFANLFTIFVFATRTAIKVSDDLSVSYRLGETTISQVVKGIYRNLARARLKRTLGSTSNLFRDPEIYRSAVDLFRDISEARNDQYIDFTEKYRVRLD